MPYGLTKLEAELAGLNPAEYEQVNFKGKFFAELVFKIYDPIRQKLWLFFDTHTGIKLKIHVRAKAKIRNFKIVDYTFFTVDKKVDWASVPFNTYWVVKVENYKRYPSWIKTAKQYKSINK